MEDYTKYASTSKCGIQARGSIISPVRRLSIEDQYTRNVPLSGPLPPTGPAPERRRNPRYPDDLRQSKALERWEQQEAVWATQAQRIADATGQNVSDLTMQRSAAIFRQTMESRTIIERMLPAMEYGHGHRSGTEFWQNLERLNTQKDPLPITLTQTQKGEIAPLEWIGRPGPSTARSFTENRFNSYLDLRKNQVAEAPNGDDFRPDFNTLVILPNSQIDRPHKVSFHTIEDCEEGKCSSASKQSFEAAFECSTAITISANGSSPTECRLVLTTSPSVRTGGTITAVNNSSSGLYYSWQRVPSTVTLAMRFDQYKTERFYFDRQPGFLLPGATLVRSVVLLSTEPGIYQEQWCLQVDPAPAVQPIITIVGTITVEDVFVASRKEKAKTMERSLIEAAMRRLLLDVISAIRPPSVPPTTQPFVPGQNFLTVNAGIVKYYSQRCIERLRLIYEEAWQSLNSVPEESPVDPKAGGKDAKGTKDKKALATSDAERPRPPAWSDEITAIYAIIYQLADVNQQNLLAQRVDDVITELQILPIELPVQSRYEIIYSGLCGVWTA